MTENFGEKLKSHYIDYIKQRKALKDNSFRAISAQLYHGNFEGLNDVEIEQLRVAQGVEKLPNIYVEFLQIMGRKAGGLFRGCSVSFEELLELKKGLQMMQKYHDVEQPPLPANSFVFLAIQGVDYFFFEAVPNQDDPPVYYYCDGLPEFYQVAPSLSSWFWEQAFYPTEKTEPIVNAYLDKTRGKTDPKS